MSSYPIEVINQALHAHDPDCSYWLERINALLKDPANCLHRKALEYTREYLKDASGLETVSHDGDAVARRLT